METETLEEQMINRIMRFEAKVDGLKEQKRGLLARSDELKKVLEDLEAKAGKEQSAPLVERIMGMIGQGANQNNIMASLSEIREEKLRSDDRDLMIKAVNESIKKLEGEIAEVQEKILDALLIEIFSAAGEFEERYNKAFSAAVAYPETWRKIVNSIATNYGLHRSRFSGCDLLRISRENSVKYRPFEDLTPKQALPV